MLGHYLLSHVITVVALLASLVMLVRLLDSKRSAQSTFAWLLAIVFLPFVAVPLFLLFGQRKFPRRAKGPWRGSALRDVPPEPGESPVAHLLRRSGAAPARSGNAFALFATGEEAYVRLLALVRSAERSIDLTVFILADDAVGRSVVEALAERAAHGVSVRVIVDAVGSSGARREAARVLAAAGGELRAFMPLRHSPVRGRTNLRSHRKLAIVDGVHVFAGGMNLADEYLGPPRPAAAPARWRDVAAVVSGPVAADATALFESDWNFCGPPAPARDHPAVPPSGDEVVQLVASGPDMIADTVYDAFLTAIFAAKKRILIVTPYYVPDETLHHAVVLAARRGIRTELLIPLCSNHRVADIARRALLRELAAEGVLLHYYPHGMVHAKAMVVDDLCAYVGSPNFDMRSLFLNYEDALFVHSAAPIALIRGFAEGLIAESVRQGPTDHENWLLERMARLLAPEL